MKRGVVNSQPRSAASVAKRGATRERSTTMATYELRPAKNLRPPGRFRRITACCDANVANRIDNSELTVMASVPNAAITLSNAKIRRRRRGPRTQEQKDRRREKERGPWQCPLWERKAFASVSGLRRHAALVHCQYCIWSGVMGPLCDGEHEKRAMDMIHRGRRHHGVSRRHQESLTASVEVLSATDGPGAADAAGGGHCRVLSRHPQTSIAMASVVGEDMPMDLRVAPTSEWSSSSPNDLSSPSVVVGEATRDCSSAAGDCSSSSAYRAVQDMDANSVAASAAEVGFEFDLATLFDELAEADDRCMILSPTVNLCGSENDGASVSCENLTSFLPVGVTLENLLQFLHASSGETDWTPSLQQRFLNELTQSNCRI
jgi:hypothetical protein